MDNLKELLFIKTKHALDTYQSVNRKNGIDDIEATNSRAEFIALYDLIEQAGLEEEYQKWKQQK